MANKITKDDIIELTHKRNNQIINSGLVPEVVREFIDRFDELAEEIKKKSADDYINVFRMEEQGFCEIEMQLLGDGVKLSYSYNENVIEVSLTENTNDQHLVNVLRVDGTDIISAYSNEKVVPDDILNYFKGTASYRNLKFITDEY
ncbi:hypothetical protein LNK15_03185 [Jeotgalicoccus huakuii]|nr:hypothetical protein [Jeotgalicoccus huakuii]